MTMTTEYPGGQQKITKAEYRKCGAYAKGYICYMQSAWNENVPNRNPYKPTSPNYKEFIRGMNTAMMNIMDCDND